jgi:hypothetical protein
MEGTEDSRDGLPKVKDSSMTELCDYALKTVIRTDDS